jgi:hypothetical protein
LLSDPPQLEDVLNSENPCTAFLWNLLWCPYEETYFLCWA